MAAFSYQELPFLVDSVITPEMMMKISSSPSSTSTTTTNSPLLSPCCFSEDQSLLLNSNSNYTDPAFEQLQFQYPFENLVNFHQDQVNSIDFKLHESSMASSENELSVTAEKQSTDQNGGGGGGGGGDGGVVGGGGGSGGRGEKGVKTWIPVKNKRKLKGDGSSPNSSKDVRGGRSKKQKKCNNEGVKEEEEEEDEGRNKIKEEKKVTSAPEAPKGYIHVRARRGQATDSHSLAERVRREKISERMKFLQALVPGCDKVTGKATMLDEIINYVQSLQSQVEFLSMKLVSVSPMVYNFGVDLDALLLEQQGLNTMPPALPSVQQCNPSTATQALPTAPVTTAETTSFHCPLVGAPVAFQQQVQRGVNPPCQQDNVSGSLYWGLGDQGGPDPINQPGFCNNMMYSFYEK